MNVRLNTGRYYWLLMVSAAGIMMITTGVRQTTGLFVAPLNDATGLGIATVLLV